MIYNSFYSVLSSPFLLYYVVPVKIVKWRNCYFLMVSYLLYAN